MITWIVIGVVVLLLLYAVAIYNRLVRLRALVREAFSGITVQLRRRADLIPNLVETVKGYATHERETLDAVTAHRADATGAGGVAATAQADAAMTGLLGPADGRRRGLSRAQGRRQFPPAAGRTEQHRDRAAVCPPLLQRHRPRPEHQGRCPSPTCSSPARSGSRKSPITRMPTRASRARPRSSSSGPSAHAPASRCAARAPRPARCRKPRRRKSGSSASTASIAVQKDGTLDVTETIRVRVENVAINHGIYRDFPTRYKAPRRPPREGRFRRLSAPRSTARPSRAMVETLTNGVRIKIGSADRTVPPGEHRYAIRYRATRMIGRFEDYDELYWNVTGNGWDFPIDRGRGDDHPALARPLRPARRLYRRTRLDRAGRAGHRGDAGRDPLRHRLARSVRARG